MTSRPPKAALVRSMFTGLATQYVNAAVSGVLQLGVVVVLARLLTPADYGVVGLASVFIALATVFSQFGLGVAIVQRPHLTDRDIRAGFTLALGFAILMTGATVVLAPWVAALFHAPRLTPILRVLSLTFPFTNLGYIAESLLDRHLAWDRALRVNLISFTFGNAVTGVGLALLGAGAWALVGSHLAWVLSRSLLLLRAQPHPMRPLIDGHEIRELTRFGRGLTLARVLNYGASQGDYLVVGRVLGVSPLGHYTRAFKLMLLPVTYFATIVTKVSFPIMARLQAERDKLSFSYLAGSAAMSIVSAPLSALMVITAPELVDVLLGPQWAPSVAPFQVLAAGVVLRNGYLMAYCLDGALGDARKRVIRDGVFAAVVVVGSLVGVRFGLVGVAGAVLLAVAVHYLVAALMSRHLLDFSWSQYFHSQWPGLVLAAATVLAALPARLGLRSVGAPSVVVLAGTGLAGVLAAGLLLFVRPRVTGRYGLTVMRMAGDALANRLPDRAVDWLRQAA